MVILRVYRGIHDHFPARRSEWVLAGIMVVWGWILFGPDETFARSVSWAQMAALAGEGTWAVWAIATGVFRFAALIVNGTFHDTWYGRWSPHVRMVASFLSCFLWLQITFGLLAAETTTTGLAVYPGLLVLDLMNVVAAASDAAKMDKARDDGP
ncbi:hypothetical protein [Bosea sp. BK604]|uniref:hypothetical protein n=1 Tax=Bosea sp. BK604 TaxID=2512180 RepID=UPI0010489B72|nr:hypothetical protein [Bosea sp. BK604]TCR60924.1 hypothetical protein EV560_115149 [Bosea sp. BK604]